MRVVKWGILSVLVACGSHRSPPAGGPDASSEQDASVSHRDAAPTADGQVGTPDAVVPAEAGAETSDALADAGADADAAGDGPADAVADAAVDACAAAVGSACTQSTDCACEGVCASQMCIACNDALLQWTGPTQNTDGTCLTDLAGFVIDYGQDAAVPAEYVLDAGLPCVPGSSIACGDAGQSAAQLACSLVLHGFANGTWYFAVYDYTEAGVASQTSPQVSVTYACP